MTDERSFAREARRRDDPWTRLVFGLSILTVGVIAWLDHLGRIDADDFRPWWPLILIAIGLAHLMSRRWIGALIWTLIGLSWLPELSFFPHFKWWNVLGLWPLLIAAGGVTLIQQALRPMRKDSATSSSFRAFTWMGGSGRKVASNDFAGGDAVVVMGGCEINLANAKIESVAVIDVLAFWGGIEIRVPKEWVIESHVTGLLGGYSNRTTNPTEGDGPRLIVRGSAIMGGVEIRNPKE